MPPERSTKPFHHAVLGGGVSETSFLGAFHNQKRLFETLRMLIGERFSVTSQKHLQEKKIKRSPYRTVQHPQRFKQTLSIVKPP